MQSISNYIGRFAPSPTGPLHFGSLVAALASYLDARHHHGTWLVRIEDLDPPRESASAPDIILHQLADHGLHWDGEVLYQSSRLDAYQAALDSLTQERLTYPCDCIRKNLPPVYPGICFARASRDVIPPASIRIHIDQEKIQLEDEIAGQVSWRRNEDLGDFIIKRKDGLFAYQLAVVVDDGFQGVTHIVRGADLLDSTPRQIYLTMKLGLSSIRYSHIPVALGESGHKLSKQTRAASISESPAIENIRRALLFLHQPIPPHTENLASLINYAITHWHKTSIPNTRSLTEQHPHEHWVNPA